MKQFVRYGVVGVINTCVGYAIFWIGLRGFGLVPHVANAISYALSLCLAFGLNRCFVFTSAPSAARTARHTAWRFALAFCGAFSLNQTILWALLHGSALAPELAQLCAMVGYSVVLYLLSKFFVFRAVPPALQA